MLSTCDICQKRDYCDNCLKKEDCYWLKACPPEGGSRRLSCEAFECAQYETCKKVKPEHRQLK